MKVKIKQCEVMDLIRSSNGKIFSAKFYKQNGELRPINARLDVKKYLNGKGLAYNPKDYGLISVFDMQCQGYRSINCETTVELKINGITYEVE